MKLINRSAMALLVLLVALVPSYGQTKATNTGLLKLGAVQAYHLDVTYNKTSHLLFPAPIRYTDLGSEYLLAGKAEDASNVLRVKAAVKDFEEETNFSVITEDGRYYSFNVCYSPRPAILSYDLLTLAPISGATSANEVMLDEMGKNSLTQAEVLLNALYEIDKRHINHIGAKSYGIRALLKGIYSHGDKLYFNIELQNRSNVPFKVDFVLFKIVDRKQAKRTVAQDRVISPLRTYKPMEMMASRATGHSIFLLDQFTISGDKLLQIDIFEKDGSRHQKLEVTGEDLVHARQLNEMDLQIK